MYHTTDTFVLVNLDKHVVLVALFVVFITLLHFYFTLTDTGHEMQFSIESFFSNVTTSAVSCEFGHMKNWAKCLEI